MMLVKVGTSVWVNPDHAHAVYLHAGWGTTLVLNTDRNVITDWTVEQVAAAINEARSET